MRPRTLLTTKSLSCPHCGGKLRVLLLKPDKKDEWQLTDGRSLKRIYTREQVLEIRNSQESAVALARRLGGCAANIRQIRAKITYRDVE